jgi:NADH dehydrogenase
MIEFVHVAAWARRHDTHANGRRCAVRRRRAALKARCGSLVRGRRKATYMKTWSSTIQFAAGVSFAAAAALVARNVRERRAHRSETVEEYQRAKTRIMILGGGFGGTRTAIELDRRLRGVPDLSILLVDRANAQVFNPLLWSVAAGSAAPTSVTVPLRTLQRGRSFHVLNAEVAAIDLEHRVVRTTAGDRNYDILVIALGSVTTVPDVPGVREHVHIFRRPADAVQLRNYLIDAIERAHQSTESDECDAWRTFVVAGGGDTGCELAAAINEYVRRVLRGLYPWLVAQPPRVVIVERADRLVPLSPPDVSTLLRAHLEAEGIEVRTGVSVEAVTNDAVHAGGSILPTHTVFWAAGVSAPDIVRNLPTRHEHNAALTVDASLRLPDYPMSTRWATTLGRLTASRVHRFPHLHRLPNIRRTTLHARLPPGSPMNAWGRSASRSSVR